MKNIKDVLTQPRIIARWRKMRSIDSVTLTQRQKKTSTVLVTIFVALSDLC